MPSNCLSHLAFARACKERTTNGTCRILHKKCKKFYCPKWNDYVSMYYKYPGKHKKLSLKKVKK